MYNPQAYDYGIKGSLDTEGMDKRLQELRNQIDKYDGAGVDIGTPDLESAFNAAGVKDPVYGEGVVQPAYVAKDHRKGSPGIDPAILQSVKDKKQFVNEYIKSLSVAPAQAEQGFDQAPAVGTQEAVPPVADGVAGLFPAPSGNKGGLKLPTLGKKDKTTKEMVEGSIQKKNPSFDGYDFQDFLEKAKATRTSDTGRGSGPEIILHPEKNELYNKLLGAGMSESDMLKAAQYSGLTNVRTGKEGKSDFNQMIDIFKNDFMVPKKTTQQVTTGIGKANNLFGGKFSMKDYNAALGYESQDKKYIKNFLKDYAAGGGKVSSKVQGLFPGINF